jgi:hypothetical protein
MANRDSPAPDAAPALWSRPEPDLKVVVGGKDFWHYSAILCRASVYFDRMLSSDSRESRTGIIEFPDGDPEEWVRFCRYLEPRSLFTASTFPVTEEDAKDLLPWFHLFGMTNLLQECDQRLSISSPDQRSTMTDILVWADTATIYDLSDTLDVMMQELKKAVDSFPEIITTEILEKMRPFWSLAAGTEFWEAVKAILPDDVKSSHDDAALKADQQLFEFVAQSCRAPAQIRTLKSEADFNAIVNLMENYRSCPRIQQNGCAAFRDPILRNDDNHMSSTVKAGIEVVVSAMTAHINESKVQEQGCAALGNLARNNDEDCISIAAKYGSEAIVSAMMAHTSVSTVQEWGCLAIVNLTLKSDESRVLIAAKHGIEAIVNAMTVHSNKSNVQEWGCLALANVAGTNDANRVLIAAKHGIEAIVGAMVAHSNSLGVQQWGCAALMNLACNNAANCLSIAAKGGIKVIVSAMLAHSAIRKVQEWGCFALFYLTVNDSVAVRMQFEGGLAVLEQNPSNSYAKRALQRIKPLIILG